MPTACPSLLLVLALSMTSGASRLEGRDPALEAGAARAAEALKRTHGPAEAARIDRGVAQVARYWRAEDGDATALEAFAKAEFVPRGPALDGVFERFETALERVGGYYVSMVRDLRRNVDLDVGPLTPLDRRLGEWDPSAHVSDDLFRNKVAFVALLNFPLTTLAERTREGGGWSRRQWAEARLAQAFSVRVPAEARARLSEAYSRADAYIADYNVRMHHVLTPDGKRPFPPGLRLISHWNLRDELKARYADPQGLAAQRLIARAMDRIVRQEIPAAVVDNPLLDWTPETNAVAVSPVRDGEPPAGATREPRAEREPDTRYARWLDVFRAERAADPFHPENPSLVDRRFNVSREIPEAQVKALLEEVLADPLAGKVARLVEKRLGRPLEPFDIWYVGFKPRGRYSEAELDAATRKRYPTKDAYAADMKRILLGLGFSEARAAFLADRIEVDASRGAGHAMGAGRRDDKAHLRTRVGASGMDYKGYNIAVHEMGHNVEQVFSLAAIDHTLLQGVPNNGFTEAMAMLFQARDLELLGLAGPDADAECLLALEELWATREIAAVSLVDMAAWRWLYEHEGASPAELREAVVGIARDVWNRHFAPVFGTRDVTLLAVYSHLVSNGLYLPDYALGHLIAFQVQDHFRRRPGEWGAEFERMCRIGSITPDAWMREAVGGPLSARPLLEAAAKAYAALEARDGAARR
jgi:hypothetical protein